MWPQDADALVLAQEELALASPEPWVPPERGGARRRLLGVLPAWPDWARQSRRSGLGRRGGDAWTLGCRDACAPGRRGCSVPAGAACPSHGSANGAGGALARVDPRRPAPRRHRSRPPATSRFGGPPGRRPRPPHGRRHTPAPRRPGLEAVGQPRGRQRAPDRQRGGRVLGPDPSGCPSTRRTPRLAGGPAHCGGTGPGRHRKAPYTRAAAPGPASRSGCPPRRTRGLPSGVTPQSTAHAVPVSGPAAQGPGPQPLKLDELLAGACRMRLKATTLGADADVELPARDAPPGRSSARSCGGMCRSGSQVTPSRPSARVARQTAPLRAVPYFRDGQSGLCSARGWLQGSPKFARSRRAFRE